MFRNIALITVLTVALITVSASEPIKIDSDMVIILPEDCRIIVGEELPLELSGAIPSEAVVTWYVNYGEVASLLPGSSAILFAPPKPSVITIYATITDAEPGHEVYINRECIVIQPEIVNG